MSGNIVENAQLSLLAQLIKVLTQWKDLIVLVTFFGGAVVGISTYFANRLN